MIVTDLKRVYILLEKIIIIPTNISPNSSPPEGLQAGNLDLTATEMKVVSLRDIATDPHAPIVRSPRTDLI